MRSNLLFNSAVQLHYEIRRLDFIWNIVAGGLPFAFVQSMITRDCSQLKYVYSCSMDQ